ncbi:MAG: FecR domain-containing protein, partial [Verrucomicrobiia bacterium]
MSSEIDELINGYLDESLTEREQRELSDWIKADPTNAKHFAKAVMLHDRLQGEISAAAANAEFAADSKVVEFPKLGAHFSKRMIQLAAAIALMLTVLYWPTGPGTKVVEIPRGVEAPHVEKGFATIAHVIDVEFGEGSELKAGQRLGEHTIFMNSGVLRLQFDSGVEVTVQGPAKYELRGPAFTKLSSGLLTANVPPGAEGFRVDTPTAEVTDLGTSFGIRLDPDGASHVSVFEGEVEVEEPDSGEKKLLKEGEEIFVTAEHKLESAKFDAKPYENIWPVSSGIVGS